jgi:hypothetical protein
LDIWTTFSVFGLFWLPAFAFFLLAALVTLLKRAGIPNLQRNSRLLSKDANEPSDALHTLASFGWILAAAVWYFCGSILSVLGFIFAVEESANFLSMPGMPISDVAVGAVGPALCGAVAWWLGYKRNVKLFQSGIFSGLAVSIALLPFFFLGYLTGIIFLPLELAIVGFLLELIARAAKSAMKAG